MRRDEMIDKVVEAIQAKEASGYVFAPAEGDTDEQHAVKVFLDVFESLGMTPPEGKWEE